MDDEQLLGIWRQVTGGEPESKRNVWMYLLGRRDGSAEALQERFDALRKTGRLMARGSYRFGDCKYVVVPTAESEAVS